MTIGEKLSVSIQSFIGSKINGGRDEILATHAKDIDKRFDSLIVMIKQLLSIHPEPENDYCKLVYENADKLVKQYTNDTI